MTIDAGIKGDVSGAWVMDTLQSAVALHQAGKLDDAEALYQQVLDSDPGNPEALHLLGVAAHQRGRISDAVELISKAIKQAPRNTVYYGNLAEAHKAMGMFDKAAATLTKAIKLKPDWAEAYNELGAITVELNKLGKAIQLFNKAIKLKPDFVEAHNNLGIAFLRQDKLDQAQQAFENALAINPDYPNAHNNLGTVLRDLDRPEDALDHYHKALAVRPEYAAAYNNLGISLHDLGRIEDSIAAFNKGIENQPNVAEFYRNLAKPMFRSGNVKQAIEICNTALHLDPDYQQAEWERSLYGLISGDWVQGWADYRGRLTLNRKLASRPEAPWPRDLSGRHILVLGEQGLGDQIFLLRFARELKARGAEFTVAVDAKIVDQVGRISFIDDVVTIKGKSATGGEIVYLGDLPFLLGVDSTPGPVELTPLADRLEAMGQRLAALGPPPYMGVTWRAGIKEKDRLFKEIPLELFAGTLAPVEATILALQRHPEPGEIDQFANCLGRDVHDFTDVNDDLEDMLALLALIDDYVGVSNTNMHLGAGVGLACRVLIPHPPEFRDMAAGETTPWHPGFRLYRQTPVAGQRQGDWQDAMVELARDLTASAVCKVAG